MAEMNKNPKQKRNKIILIVILVLIVLCIIVCGVAYFGLRKAAANVIQLDPAQAKNLASQISDYDLPVGYQEMAGTSTFGLITAAIADENEKNTIWLVQAPTDNLPDPGKFLRDAIAYEKNNPITWTADDIKIYTIRGKKSSVTIYNGVTQDNKKYHAWSGKFAGKEGPALIIIVGPDETWDENVAENFINSMR